MTTTEIALLSTCIGASAGLLSQFIANTLKDKSDKKKTKIDLISEERKLTSSPLPHESLRVAIPQNII